MEEKKNCTDGSCSRSKCSGGAIPFLAGVIVALAFGWWVFPDLLYSEQEQPILFRHWVHLEKVPQRGADISCSTCHSLREDGSFTGVPALAVCAECHQQVNSPVPTSTSTAEEKQNYASEVRLVEEHVRTGKPVAWQVHQAQPDNVFFSHAAHFEKCYTCHLTMKGKFDLGTPEMPGKLCFQCHITLDELNSVPPVYTNVLTSYSKTTMKMWECESCHAHPGHFNVDGKGRTAANNACLTCHK